MFRCAAVAGLAIVIATGCGEKQDPGGGAGDDADVDGGVTYSEHVAPILDGHCIGCHSGYLEGADRNGAPPGVDFDTYEAAVESGDAANVRIQAGSMPPSGSLSAGDKAIFQAWVDEGFPE